MDDEELRKLLEELHQKIEKTDTVDKTGREILGHLSVDIRNLLERTGHEERLRGRSGRSGGSKNRSATLKCPIPA